LVSFVLEGYQLSWERQEQTAGGSSVESQAMLVRTVEGKSLVETNTLPLSDNGSFLLSLFPLFVFFFSLLAVLSAFLGNIDFQFYLLTCLF